MNLARGWLGQALNNHSLNSPLAAAPNQLRPKEEGSEQGLFRATRVQGDPGTRECLRLVDESLFSAGRVAPEFARFDDRNALKLPEREQVLVDGD